MTSANNTSRHWPQVVTLGERVFATGGQCLEVLFAEVKELIDALKK